MRANRPKSKRPKKKVTVDSLLDIVESNLKDEKKTCSKRYLTITYIGYYDNKSNFIILDLFIVVK